MRRFVRFQTNLRGSDTALPLGVFHAAHRFVESAAVEDWAIEQAEAICDWFNRNLVVPRLKRATAIFWFRSECFDMIQRLWELAALLQDHGTLADLVHTNNPGRVIYEDEFQVAAIPWKHWRSKRLIRSRQQHPTPTPRW